MRVSQAFPAGAQAIPGHLAFGGSVGRTPERPTQYQPMFDLRSCRIFGFEAIPRQPLGEAGPARAGDIRLANIQAKRMQAQVLDDMQAWHEAGLLCGTVSLKVSATHITQDGFARNLLDALHYKGLDPAILTLDLSPAVFVRGPVQKAQDALRTLVAYGVGVALNDFGSGFGAWAFIKHVPVRYLKIDQAFMAGIGRDAQDEAIVRTLSALGACLGIMTVAQGVDRLEQAEFVFDAGCDVGQGALFGGVFAGWEVPDLIDCISGRSGA